MADASISIAAARDGVRPIAANARTILSQTTTKSPSASVATEGTHCRFSVKLLSWSSAPRRTCAEAPEHGIRATRAQMNEA
jgi:hypothetical protein